MWDAMISGPDDSPWEGDFGQGFSDRWHVCVAVAFFRELSICPSRCSICYSHLPSQWQQLGCARHVVFSDGMVCLDIIKDKWSPVNTVSMILTSIQVVSFRFSDVQSLLNDPNPNSPANSEAASVVVVSFPDSQLYVNNIREYKRRVRECAERSLQMNSFLVCSKKQAKEFIRLRISLQKHFHSFIHSFTESFIH